MPINHFPLKTIRNSQRIALEKIKSAIDAGKTHIICELPTGSGKSAIATALSRYMSKSYIITPTRHLQGAYSDDFGADLKTLKGRSSYPCVYQNVAASRNVINLIQEGKNVPIPKEENSCARGNCVGKTSTKKQQIVTECVSGNGNECPYTVMLSEALRHKTICCNQHSFFFNQSLDRLEKRDLIIFDECHDLPDFMRSVMTTAFTVYREITEVDLIGLKTPLQWVQWFKQDSQFLTIPNDSREDYLGRLEKMEKAIDAYGKDAIVKVTIDKRKANFEFIPPSVGGAFREAFINYAGIFVYMSGTIYDHQMFSQSLGLPQDKVAYIRMPSEFPATNRPVVLPRHKDLDLSYLKWDENFDKAVAEIRNIAKHHSKFKGLIHSSSYAMARQLSYALADTDRIITHTPDNFAEKLAAFYASEKPLIFISPAIKQGVDFSFRRADWQVLVRPQYPTIKDPFVKYKLQNNHWAWYNLQTMVIVGQQCGRIVRAETDVGVTYLLDSRFIPFLQKVNHLLPQWFKDGIVA